MILQCVVNNARNLVSAQLCVSVCVCVCLSTCRGEAVHDWEICIGASALEREFIYTTVTLVGNNFSKPTCWRGSAETCFYWLFVYQ